MKALTKLVIVAQAATGMVLTKAEDARKRFNEDRGSLTLEQIIWTVAIAVIALAIVAIVVAAINTKAAELPL